MALISCPECGREISNHALACPGCAFPITPDEIQIESQFSESEADPSDEAIEVVKNYILKGENRWFIFRLLVVAASYAGISFWLHAIRETGAIWFVRCLIGLRLFLFLTIFVVCSLRLRQCRRHSWWLWLMLMLCMSIVNNWEIVFISAAAMVTLMISGVNDNVSEERQHLLSLEGDDP